MKCVRAPSLACIRLFKIPYTVYWQKWHYIEHGFCARQKNLHRKELYMDQFASEFWWCFPSISQSVGNSHIQRMDSYHLRCYRFTGKCLAILVVIVSWSVVTSVSKNLVIYYFVQTVFSSVVILSTLLQLTSDFLVVLRCFKKCSDVKKVRIK